MAKRLTKAHREVAGKARLRRRVADVVAGACGGDQDGDGWVFGGEELSRIVPALRSLFLCEEDGRKNGYAFEPHCLNHYTDVDGITEHLWNAGGRA
jgi:hypothetical protein